MQIKKVIFFVILFLFIFGHIFSAFAITAENVSTANKNAAFQFASRISHSILQFNEWENIKLENEKKLYDYNGSKINAIAYDVYGYDNTNIGYIIVDSGTCKVVEFSANTSPYGNLLECFKKNKDMVGKVLDEYYIYYPGHHAFAAKVESSNDYQIFEFTQDQYLIVETDDLTVKMPINETVSQYSIMSTTEHYKLISGVPDANYTISCIPTAIGNIIGYWDTHGYPNLIISPKTIYSAITEINTNLINNCGNNQTNSAIPSATQQYCRASGRYPNNFTVTNIWNPSYTQFKSQINYNRPTLVGFTSAGPYGGCHMTTGVGYYYDDYFPQYKYIYVHDAWSSTPVNYYVLWGSYNDFIATIVP